MVKREELISDLKNDLSFEEDLISKVATFYKALGWRKCISEDRHKEVEGKLDVLKSDSEKHASIIKEMIDYVEKTDKNEY